METTALKADLCPAVIIEMPGEWVLNDPKAPRQAVLDDINRLAGTIAKGIKAVSGTYMRMVREIRDYDLPDQDVREVLLRHFSPARVSEILRIAHAPPEVFHRIGCGFYGWKTALRACRGYQVNPREELKRRRMVRAARRLQTLADNKPLELKLPGAVLKLIPE